MTNTDSPAARAWQAWLVANPHKTICTHWREAFGEGFESRDRDMCQWMEHKYDTGHWNSTCGASYFDEDCGIPTDTGTTYCYRCGKRVKAIPYVEVEAQ